MKHIMLNCREIDGDKLSITEDPSDFSSHLTDTVKNPSKPKEFVFESHACLENSYGGKLENKRVVVEL